MIKQAVATTNGATLNFVTEGLKTKRIGTLSKTEITVGGSIVTKFTTTLTILASRVDAINSLGTRKDTFVAFIDTSADTCSTAYLYLQGEVH